MGERGIPPDVERSVISLREQLSYFAKADNSTREDHLPELVSFIRDVATPTVIEFAPEGTEHQIQEFEGAIEAVLETPFKSPRFEGEVKPWAGGFTAINLDIRGNIVAAARKLRLDDDSDANLYPEALIPALYRLHLYLNNQQAGVEDRINYPYLRSIGLNPEKDIFLGEAMKEEMIVGASGCDITAEYVRRLLPFSEAPLLFKRGLYSRRINREFAKAVANELGGLHKTVAVEEPYPLMLLGMSH